MKVSGKFVVSDVFNSESGKVQNISLVDLEHGGTPKITLFNQSVDVKPGMMVNADLVIKAGTGKYGLTLVYQSGTFAKI